MQVSRGPGPGAQSFGFQEGIRFLEKSGYLKPETSTLPGLTVWGGGGLDY